MSQKEKDFVVLFNAFWYRDFPITKQIARIWRIWGQIFILDICPSLFCISLNLFPMPAHSATHVPLRGSYRLTRALGREKQI